MIKHCGGTHITPLNWVDPMSYDLTVVGRCISLWHSHRVNQEKDPYSLDFVLQDTDSNCIQVYIKKELMYKYLPLFVEGQCYKISNFDVAENGGKLPQLLPLETLSPLTGLVSIRYGELLFFKIQKRMRLIALSGIDGLICGRSMLRTEKRRVTQYASCS